jgi:2-dehydro-3-deoxygluconokinase
MTKVVTFGEIMMRLAMPGHKRFIQSLPGTFDSTFAGAEANVAASLAMLGYKAYFVTALPDNHLAHACVSALKKTNVDTRFISIVKKGRLGVYFLETGANQRPSNVIYDRAGSSISVSDIDSYDFDAAFKDAAWFHTTGITPGLSEKAYEISLEAIKKAKEKKLTVSLDLNFRNKLWNWDSSISKRALAQKCTSNMLPYVDIVIGNEEDASDVLGIEAGKSKVHSGKLDFEGYEKVAKEIIKQFNNVSKVAITLRESISASHNNWGGMLYDASEKKTYFAPLDLNGNYCPYQIKNIVDRVGGGDSFCAGLIFALCDNKSGNDNQFVINFAAAASCLAHSIEGDFNFSTKEEVMKLAGGNTSGRVVR